VSQAAVLVISETPGFSQNILDRFQLEPILSSPTAMSCDLCGNLVADSFDLAIIEGLSASRLETLLRQLEPLGKTLLVLVPDGAAADIVATISPRALVIYQTEASKDRSIHSLMLLATEIVKRLEAVDRAQRAEQALAASESSALLGRYITEMRHTINNALTSVMGNSELLLFEPGGLSAHQRSQIETVRTMSVRIHEIMQRLASLELEMKWVQKQNDHVQQSKQATAAGND